MLKCEKCGVQIPDDSGNMLCLGCYDIIEKARIESEEKKAKFEALKSTNGISDPNYKENPEQEDKEQWATNAALFDRHGVLIWKPTRQMYNFIRDWCRGQIMSHPQYPKFIWKPKIVDVGCGSGVGSNIISQEADMVWGIDKNKKSVMFAKEAFTRYKNNIYYTPQMSFEHIDLMNDERDFMKFDVVTMIEVIEHINDYASFVKKMIEKFNKSGPERTTYFISTPNRNNKHLGQDRPTNKFHVREWTSGEFYGVMSQFFSEVKLVNAIGLEIPIDEYETTTHTPLIAICRV